MSQFEFEGGEQEFDDWFNDADAAGASLENQAAKFNDRLVEERTNRSETLDEKDVRFAGQVFVKFGKPDGRFVFRKASGHLVKKNGDDESYTMLTTQHIFSYETEDKTELDFVSGLFFLRRQNKENYAASFTFSAENEDVVKREMYEKGQDKTTGTDIAAVRVFLKKGEVGDLPDFKDVDCNEEVECTMSGYADVVIADKPDCPGEAIQKSIEYTLFSKEGKIDKTQMGEGTGGDVVMFSMDCSAGQDGGALVNKTGQPIAIHTGVASDGSEDFYVAIMLTNETYDWVQAAFE